MKLQIVGFLVTLVCLVSACQQTVQKNIDISENYVRVTGESVSALVDKKLYLDDLDGNNISLSDDGTFDGKWDGAPIAGTWEMRDDYWCRVLTEFKESARLGAEDCQLWEFDGASVRGTRNKGCLLYTSPSPRD